MCTVHRKMNFFYEQLCYDLILSHQKWKVFSKTSLGVNLMIQTTYRYCTAQKWDLLICTSVQKSNEKFFNYSKWALLLSRLKQETLNNKRDKDSTKKKLHAVCVSIQGLWKSLLEYNILTLRYTVKNLEGFNNMAWPYVLLTLKRRHIQRLSNVQAHRHRNVLYHQ